MNIYLNQARRHSRPAMSPRRRRRRGHDVLIMLLLGVLAVIMALAWLAEHLAVLAGVALLVGTAFYLGQLHERRRAISSRPGQGQAAGPAAAGAVPTAALPLAGDWDELGTRQPASLQAGPGSRDKLLADPLSGAHPLRRA